MFLLEIFKWYIKFIFGIPVFMSCLVILFGVYGTCKSVFKKMFYKKDQEIEDTEIISAGGLMITFFYFLKFLVYKIFGINKSIFEIFGKIKNIINPIPIWLALLSGFLIIVILSLIGAVKENKEEKEYEKRKEEKRIADQTDINKYVEKLKAFDFKDENIKSKIKGLIENLEKLRNKDKENGNKNGGEFAGKYLPILVETLSRAEKIKLTNKEVNNIVGAIATINIAIEKVIEQSEEPTLEDINATTTALSQVLELKFKEKEDFK